jgi:uncharacterized membrane protein YeaQ/YmgE (transglycosylase-associated protein family)
MSTAVTPPTSRRQQFIQTYRMARKTDRALGWWILGAFVLGAVVGFAAIWFLPGDGVLALVLAIVGAVLVGLLLALTIFGRRAQKAAYRQMEGQVGAAASALTMLRRGWKTDPVVGFNRQQDVVHRVVGPPGIMLVGEGNAQRLRTLMATEHRKHERVLPDTPIHEVVCGNGEGEVPLPKLVRHVSKLGKNLKPGEMTDVLNRLKAIDAQRGALPLPKGPIPTSMKGQRGQQRGR